MTLTGTDGSFAVLANGPININTVGCIVSRDTLSPLSPELKLDSVRFKLTQPYDTVHAALIR